MRLSRRGLLAATGGAVVLTACGQEAKPAQAGELLRSKAKLPAPFQVPLPVPPVKKPTRSDAKADYYRVVQRKASLEILPGLKTEVMGYDGLFPGPTFDRETTPTVTPAIFTRCTPGVTPLTSSKATS